MTTPIRAVAYYRKSNDDRRRKGKGRGKGKQDGDDVDRKEVGESIEQQQQWAHALAPRENVVLVAEFMDQAKPGWDTARRFDFHRMITFCEEQHRLGRPIEAVVIWHPNRFSRSNSWKTGAFLDRLQEAGVRMMLTHGRVYHVDRYEDRLVLGVEQEASNHKYLTDLSEAVLRGKRSAAEEGLWNGGKAPYGYRVEDQKLVPHPAEAEVVRWLFDLYATQEVSLKGLARRLQEKGIPSPTGMTLWVPTTVARVLSNVLYLGDLPFFRKSYALFAGRVRVKAGRKVANTTGIPSAEADQVKAVRTHKALVTPELFDRVQKRLAENRRRTSPRKTAPFVLSGLLVCGHCDRRMIAQTVCPTRNGVRKHSYRVYTCASYHVNGPASGCHHYTVQEDRMLAAVAKKVAALFTPEAVAAVREEIRRQESLPDAAAREAAARETALECLQADLSRKIGNLVDRLAENLPDDVLVDVRGRLKDLSAERERARAELAAIRVAAVATEDLDERVEKITARFAGFQKAIRSGDPAVTQALLRELVDRVEIYFTTERLKVRTRTDLAHGLVNLRPEAWLFPDSPNLEPALRRSC
jgi:site-specific DNA recombinase